MNHDAILKSLEEHKRRTSPYSVCCVKVLEDYLKVYGKVLRVKHLLAWGLPKNPGTDIRQDLRFVSPILVKITECSLDDLLRWNDGHLDPEWNAVIVDEHHGIDTDKFDVSSVEVYGNSYDVRRLEEVSNDSGWELAE